MIGQSRIREEVLDVTKTRHTVFHGLHVKVLAGAQRHRVDRFTGIVPQNIADFLRGCPAWLCEVIRVVDGKTRYDDVVDVEIDVATRKVGERRVRYLVPPAYCPLVVLGEYVLTGWGSEEASIETARQNWSQYHLVAVALVVLSGIMSGLGRLEATWIGYAAVLPMAMSLAAFLVGRREKAIAESKPSDLTSLLGKGFYWLALCLGAQLMGSGLAILYWPFLGLGGVLVWIGASGIWDSSPSDRVEG
jgi:hypothetical protein